MNRDRKMNMKNSGKRGDMITETNIVIYGLDRDEKKQLLEEIRKIKRKIERKSEGKIGYIISYKEKSQPIPKKEIGCWQS